MVKNKNRISFTFLPLVLSLSLSLPLSSPLSFYLDDDPREFWKKKKEKKEKKRKEKFTEPFARVYYARVRRRALATPIKIPLYKADP